MFAFKKWTPGGPGQATPGQVSSAFFDREKEKEKRVVPFFFSLFSVLGFTTLPGPDIKFFISFLILLLL